MNAIIIMFIVGLGHGSFLTSFDVADIQIRNKTSRNPFWTFLTDFDEPHVILDTRSTLNERFKMCAVYRQ